MLTVVLFIAAKTWKQPDSPSEDEWIKKIWCTHTHNGIRLSHENR